MKSANYLLPLCPALVLETFLTLSAPRAMTNDFPTPYADSISFLGTTSVQNFEGQLTF